MMLDLLDQRDRQRQASEAAAPTDPIGQARSTTSTETTAQATLKASEIGFFFPNMPLSWGDKDIIEKDGKLYYRNVYSFTNRIRVATQTRDTNKVKQVLDTCFRGEAELWWNNQLDDILRAGYLATEGVEKLCKALETRFRPPPSEALAKYNATRYSVEDCRSRRSITEYVATLEAAAKACGLGPAQDDPQKRGLVIQTWMHLDLPLRETVDEPAEDLTLDEFTKVLLRKQNNWFDRYPPHGSRPRQAPYYQPPRYQSEQRHQPALQPQGPQFMPGPNWHPTSARQSSAPVSYPSRYSNQLGPPNSWNNQNTRNSTYPTYQFKSQSHWQSPNAPSQQGQSQNPSQAQDQTRSQDSYRSQDPYRTQRPPFGPTSSQSTPAPYGQSNRNSFQHNTGAPPGNSRPSGQRAYAAAPDESAQFLTEPESNEPKSEAEPNASDSTGYWIEPPSTDSYGPIPKTTTKWTHTWLL